jgi:hypothetical protein
MSCLILKATTQWLRSCKHLSVSRDYVSVHNRPRNMLLVIHRQHSRKIDEPRLFLGKRMTSRRGLPKRCRWARKPTAPTARGTGMWPFLGRQARGCAHGRGRLHWWRTVSPKTSVLGRFGVGRDPFLMSRARHTPGARSRGISRAPYRAYSPTTRSGAETRLLCAHVCPAARTLFRHWLLVDLARVCSHFWNPGRVFFYLTIIPSFLWHRSFGPGVGWNLLPWPPKERMRQKWWQLGWVNVTSEGAEHEVD